MKVFEAVAIIIVILGSFFTGYLYIDTRYALAEDHKQLELRVDKTDTQLAIQQAMTHYYFIKSQLRKYPGDIELQEELDTAKEDLKDLKIKLKKLKGANDEQSKIIVRDGW